MLSDLSQFDVIFCDSSEALQKLRDIGVRANASVRTSSPYLLQHGAEGFSVQALEARLQGEPLCRFKAGIRPLATDLYDVCMSFAETREFARSMARASVLYQKVIIKAACLQEDDFDAPRLHVRMESGDTRHDSMLNAPWGILLAGNSRFRSETVAISQPHSADLASARRLKRWLHQGVEYLGYRMARTLSQQTPWLFRSDMRAFVLKENELLFETAYHLARRRVSIHKLQHGATPTVPGPTIPSECLEALKARVQAFLVEHLCESAAGVCCRLLLAEMAEHARRQAAAHERWLGVLREKTPAGEKAAVLTNYPGMPEEAGLFTAAGALRVPIVGFQHGVSRELNAVHGDAGVENSAAHLTLVYNETAREESNRTQFAHWPTLAVGYPAIGRRLARLGRVAFERTEPFLFVSTSVYRGNTHMVTGTWTDEQTAQFELKLISEVLDRLPSRVTYKPYPYLTRYADPDPALEAAKAARNLSVVSDNIDMRYLIGSARVVITCRASSTTGWCLMGGRPLIFINVPGQMPLTAQARQAFEESLFLFDAEMPDLHSRLTSFLSRPIDEIEAEWQVKSAARQHLMQTFIDTDAPSAGRAAADYLLTHVFSGRFFDTHREREPVRKANRSS